MRRAGRGSGIGGNNRRPGETIMPLSAIEAFYIAIGLLSIAAIFIVNRGLYGRGSVG
jgi:hypothetical protein